MDEHITSAVQLLNDNPPEVFQSVSSILLQICDNILNHPEEPKYRRLRLSNANVSNKLLPASGAIECLFEMGFEEADDSFVLPGLSSLNAVRQFRAILTQKIAQNNVDSKLKCISQVSSAQTSKRNIDSKSKSIIQLSPDTSVKSHKFLLKIYLTANRVLQYEDEAVQSIARACVPKGELWVAAQNRLHNTQLEKVGIEEAEAMGLPDLFLLELLQWFKHRFFSWVDKPSCQYCSGPTTFAGMSSDPAHRVYAPNTEMYQCLNQHITYFHRYIDPAKLLESRRGRCGEWASCFTLICRSLGMDVRQVFDETDHVWTEVWSTTQGRWLHCDSCEATIDAPLTYQVGWGKKLSYCIAYSRGDVQDVTWRYTQEPIEVVVARRKECTEGELLKTLHDVNTQLQSTVTNTRRKYLERRLIQELCEFIIVPGHQRVISDTETQGRQSGSQEWREQRKEIGHGEINHLWVWTPSSSELKDKLMTVMFSASRNCYQKKGSDQFTMQNWTRGIYKASNIARKEEHDWKMVYLSRRAGSQEKGNIEWRFEVPVSTGMEIASVRIMLSSATFHSGVVSWYLKGDKLSDSIILPTEGQFHSEEVSGCSQLTLQAELFGGDWQHTQLCRQSMNDLSFPLQVSVLMTARKT